MRQITERWSDEQGEVWRRVEALWELRVRKDVPRAASALHPRYRGWADGDDEVQDRDAALQVLAETPELDGYTLEPQSLEVFGATAVVHYRYTALPRGSDRVVMGKWTEVYAKVDLGWQLVAVSGGAEQGDPAAAHAGPEVVAEP